MKNNTLRYLLLGIVTIFIQVMFIKNINILGLIHPNIFPIFLLLLPNKIKTVPLMLIGFVMGYILDMFYMNIGVGMATSVFLCFIRPYIIRIFHNTRDMEESDFELTGLGMNFLTRYLFTGLFVFHATYFLIELGEAYNILYILLKSILSAALALILYILAYMFFTPKKEKLKNERKI